jgi:transcriptional regulator with XRE-family HTH domain
MKRAKETFKFASEMGARLRELQLKAGVTQQELAVLMGRQGKGNHQLIGKVELGKAHNPSLGFVADYLRACRASFTDIADLLNGLFTDMSFGDRFRVMPQAEGFQIPGGGCALALGENFELHALYREEVDTDWLR